MADETAAQLAKPNQTRTFAESLGEATAMGDLSRFAIDDLTPEEEDAFFKIIEDA